jgi:hypothetical protein
MGLDMMLYRQGENGRQAEEVMYWRKVNAIHNWFVQNVQNGVDECEPHNVTVAQLMELRDLCVSVVDNPDLADNLLPTASGFFFGSTEHDEWYFDNIARTVNELDDLLAEAAEDEMFVYRSSW